jgi:hypothetical protein
MPRNAMHRFASLATATLGTAAQAEPSTFAFEGVQGFMVGWMFLVRCVDTGRCHA